MNGEIKLAVEQEPEWTTHVFSPGPYHPSIELPTFVARDPGAAAYLRSVLEDRIENNERFALVTAENGQRLTTLEGLTPQPGLPKASIAIVPGDHDPVKGILPLLKTFKRKNSNLKIAVAEDYPHSIDELVRAMEAEHMLPDAIFVNSNYTLGDNLLFLRQHDIVGDEVPCRVVPNPAFDEYQMMPPQGHIREKLLIPSDIFLLGIFGMPEQDIPSVDGGPDHNTCMMETIRDWLLTQEDPMTVVYRPHGRSNIKVHPALKNLPPNISVYQFPDNQWKAIGIETPDVWPECTAVVMGRSTLGQELALVRDIHSDTLPIPVEAILESNYGEIPHDRTLARNGALFHASSPEQLRAVLTNIRKNPKKEDAKLKANKGAFIKSTGWKFQGIPVISGTIHRLEMER